MSIDIKPVVDEDTILSDRKSFAEQVEAAITTALQMQNSKAYAKLAKNDTIAIEYGTCYDDKISSSYEALDTKHKAKYKQTFTVTYNVYIPPINSQLNEIVVPVVIGIYYAGPGQFEYHYPTDFDEIVAKTQQHIAELVLTTVSNKISRRLFKRVFSKIDLV